MSIAVQRYVQCHVCPLKVFCKFSAADASEQFVHYEKTPDMNLRVITRKLWVATTNCPLKQTVWRKLA